MVRSLLFPEKLIHRPAPGKGFFFNTVKPLRVLSDTDDLRGDVTVTEGVVYQCGKVISH